MLASGLQVVSIVQTKVSTSSSPPSMIIQNPNRFSPAIMSQRPPQEAGTRQIEKSARRSGNRNLAHVHEAEEYLVQPFFVNIANQACLGTTNYFRIPST